MPCFAAAAACGGGQNGFNQGILCALALEIKIYFSTPRRSMSISDYNFGEFDTFPPHRKGRLHILNRQRGAPDRAGAISC